MLEELAKAIEQAARQGDPRAAGMLDQLRRENDGSLRLDHERQKRLARKAAEKAEAARKKEAQRVMAAQQAAQRQPAQVAAATQSRPASANAATIAGWAKPSTLRSQFLLTEVLKPPMSMRPARH